MNHPLFFPELTDKAGEILLRNAVAKPQLLSELLQLIAELIFKNRAQGCYRKEEFSAAFLFPLPICCEPSTRHDAVQVRMETEPNML